MAQKKIRSGIVRFLIYIIVGAGVGAIVAVVLSHMQHRGETGLDDTPLLLFNLLLVFIAVLVAIRLQVIVHEAGHLVFGLSSGYKFVSFRIGSFTLINKSGHLHIKRYSVPGTGGQCLMMPPDLPEEKLPYRLYNLGGIIFNLVFSLFAILLITTCDLPLFLFIFLLVFAIFGFIFALLNGIPMRLSGIANDGYNIKLLSKDQISLRVFYLQLKINGLQAEGVRLKDMPKGWFEVPDNADMHNGFHLSLFLLRAAWYMDQLMFDEARECLESIDPYASNLIGLYQKERDCELLFLEIIGEGRGERISELYTDEVKTYIKQYNKYMFSKKRILYTYTIAVEKDKEKAETIFNDALKMQDRYPLSGDAESELEIMEYVRKIYL